MTCHHDTPPTLEYLVVFKALLTQYLYFGQILLKIGYFHKYLSKNLICHINIYVIPLPIGYHTDTPLPMEYHHDTILHWLRHIIISILLQLYLLFRTHFTEYSYIDQILLKSEYFGHLPKNLIKLVSS